ncbi:DUF2321 domain-containing protein [Candidatus Kuenenbacteria bacterium]|nr:DUF2321 domain-containing protein [Candidatus Kuenenbacteria bacterium]
MSTKCKKCKAPITGFLAKIAGLAGVKQSTKNPDYCNKCEKDAPQAPAPAEVKKEEPKDLYEAAEEKKEEAPQVETKEPVKEETKEAPKPENKEEDWAEELRAKQEVVLDEKKSSDES